MKNAKEVDASKQALSIVRELIMKDTRPMDDKNLMPGNLVFFTYDAKDKTKRWDKTPMVFCLRLSKNYVLGLNFHYLPIKKRHTLYRYLFAFYGKEIMKKQEIIFNWFQIRRFILKLGAPVIRLYIRKRISKRGVCVPYDKHLDAINLNVQTFIQGSPSSEVLFHKAAKDYYKKRKK